MHKEIRNYLLSLQDIKFKQFHSSLCPGTKNIIGIKLPILRNYAKKLSKEKNIQKYISFNKTIYYEEVMLQALLIGNLKELNLTTIKNFIPKIDNWAVCDTFCNSLKIINKNKEVFWTFMQQYIKSKEEFKLRFAIVIMLGYYIDEKYIDKVLDILNNIKHNGYYVKMAIAWAISVAFVKFQDKTFKYLKNNNLDVWTYNKSLQKILESYRVSKTTKTQIRKMKK